MEPSLRAALALFDTYGHMHCGIYLNVTQGGEIREGDRLALS